MRRCLPLFSAIPSITSARTGRTIASIAFLSVVIASVFMMTACGPRRGAKDKQARAPYLPLSEIEATYGYLITSGNHPTPEQNGTGERMGLFVDESGTVWGLPLSMTNDGAVLVCAPSGLRDEPITDTFPADWVVIGSMNEPTGWRGGTGNLELLFRSGSKDIRWKAVHGALLAKGGCWAPENPGPPQRLYYYRLAPGSGK